MDKKSLLERAASVFPRTGKGVKVEHKRPARTKQVKAAVRAVGAFIQNRMTNTAHAVGNALDSVIGVVLPTVALRRQHCRLMMRGYDAANQNRLNSDVDLSRKDANSELRSKRMPMMSLSREEQRNDPFFSNILRTMRNNVVGDDESDQAVSVRPAIRKRDPDGQMTDELDEEKNKQVAEWWKIYKDKLHLYGQYCFNELLGVFQNGLVVSGEPLGIIHNLPAPGSDLNFSIEDIETDRMPTTGESWGTPFMPFPGAPDGHTILDGIERDKEKRIVAYHVLPYHPGNEYLWGPVQTIRIPLERMIHYYEPLRAEQSRGAPFCASGLESIEDVNATINNENKRAKIQAMLVGHFEQAPNPLSPGVTPITDLEGREVTEVQSGQFTQGSAKFQPYGSATPNASLKDYLNFNGRRIGCSANMGKSSATKDYSDLSFSTYRGEQHEDRRGYRFLQGLHVRYFIKKKLWPAFINALIVADKLQLDEADLIAYAARPGEENFDIRARANLEACEVDCPDWEYVNPLQEIQADILALINGKITFQDFIGKRPLEEHVMQYKKGVEELRKAGFELPWMTGTTEAGSGGGGFGDGGGETESSGAPSSDKTPKMQPRPKAA